MEDSRIGNLRGWKSGTDKDGLGLSGELIHTATTVARYVLVLTVGVFIGVVMGKGACEDLSSISQSVQIHSEGIGTNPKAAEARGYHTTSEVAQMLGVTQREVHYQLADNELPGEKVGSRWRIPLNWNDHK